MCQRKGQNVNWALFAKWTIKGQLQKLNFSKTSQGDGETRGQRASVGVIESIKGQNVADKKEAELEEEFLPQDMGSFRRSSRKDSCHFIPIVEGLSEWQGVLSILEIKAFQQELDHSSFLKLRDNCRVSCQT